MSKTIISTEAAPTAIGPYSQAVEANGFVFTSGVIPLDPLTSSVVEGGIEEQARQVLENLKSVLAAAGSSLSQAVKTTCFLTDLNHFATFNGVYASYFDERPPARSTVQVAKLPLGVLVEVECVALLSERPGSTS